MFKLISRVLIADIVQIAKHEHRTTLSLLPIEKLICELFCTFTYSTDMEQSVIVDFQITFHYAITQPIFFSPVLRYRSKSSIRLRCESAIGKSLSSLIDTQL